MARLTNAYCPTLGELLHEYGLNDYWVFIFAGGGVIHARHAWVLYPEFDGFGTDLKRLAVNGEPWVDDEEHYP